MFAFEGPLSSQTHQDAIVAFLNELAETRVQASMHNRLFEGLMWAVLRIIVESSVKVK